MSESRETDDREAKRSKYSDSQPEQRKEEDGEEKSQEVSKEGIPLASTPTEAERNSEMKNQETEAEVNTETGKQETEIANADTKGPDQVNRKRNRVSLGFDMKKRNGIWNVSTREETATSAGKTAAQQEQEDLEKAIELSRESFRLSSMGSDHVTPNPSGDEGAATISGDLARPESGDLDAVVDGSNSDEEEIMLFEMQIPRSNWLVIPAAAAAAFFPPISAYCESNMEDELQITDCDNKEWTMTLVNYIEESVYLITKGWTPYAAWHKLEPTDVIAFYMPSAFSAEKHYQVNFVGLGENLAGIPEFTKGNFLFDLELQLADIEDSRLFIPIAEVETHFPAIMMVPGTGRTKEIVKFTDARSKDWYMEITLYEGVGYMITDGWEDFVREHKLEALDVIMFYIPARPLHTKHFLIEYVRKKEAGSNPSQQPGSSTSEEGDREKEGGSNPSQQPGSSTSEHGDPGRRSRSGKGKEKVYDF